MTAPQDAWAKPLAKELVDLFRSQDLTLIRVTQGVYDETTGLLASSETQEPASGAVLMSGKMEEDGVMQGNKIEVWMDHTTTAWPVTTEDALLYLGKRWKIVEVGPTYSSGPNDVYASKITARAE